jgi:hypothetical protein
MTERSTHDWLDWLDWLDFKIDRYDQLKLLENTIEVLLPGFTEHSERSFPTICSHFGEKNEMGHSAKQNDSDK